MDDESMLLTMQQLALGAGMLILGALERAAAAERLPDGALVGKANRAAEAMISSGLESLGKDRYWIARERDAEVVPDGKTGREGFVFHALGDAAAMGCDWPDFTVEIALIRAGRRIAEVVYAPTRRQLDVTGDGGAFRTCFDEKMLKQETCTHAFERAAAM